MKIKWAFLKKPSVIVGAVILFFILLFMLNKGSGSSSSQVVNSGPTDAQVAAQTQLALAQMSAGLQGQAIQVDYAKSQDQNATALAVAQIQATLQGQSLAVQQAIAAQTVAAQVHGLDLQYQTGLNNNQTQLDALKSQYNYGIVTQAITAETQMQMSKDQLAAYEYAGMVDITKTLGTGKYASTRLPIIQSFYNATQNGQSGQAGSVSLVIPQLTAAGQLT